MTYKLLKSKIEKHMYVTQEEMQVMLDVFYIGGRINQSEYEELTALLASKHVVVTE